jgi:hypothetical protein
MRTQTRFLTASLFLILLINNKSYGQSNTDTLINAGMTLELNNDTLYSSTGLKFFIGQKLVIGIPAGNGGYFRSIIHRKAALVPSIWGPDSRYENAIENHVNKKKSREIVKKLLLPGNVVTIKRIFFSKTGKPYFYMASFTFSGEDFNCDLKLALILGELILHP